MEEWQEIDEFPGYAVSNRGRVMNMKTDLIKIQSVNQQGIPHVIMNKEGKPFRREVIRLVAHTFLKPHDQSHFDTPINLDGERLNNDIDNLVWRPRWFAVRYHQQFKRPIPFGSTGKFQIESGEEFDSVRDLAKTHGLLEKEIIMAAHNAVPVFPHWFHVYIIED